MDLLRGYMKTFSFLCEVEFVSWTTLGAVGKRECPPGQRDQSGRQTVTAFQALSLATPVVQEPLGREAA